MELEVSHNLLALRKGFALTIAFLPVAYVVRFSTTDVLSTEMFHEGGRIWKGPGAAFPQANAGYWRGRQPVD